MVVEACLVDDDKLNYIFIEHCLE